MKEIMYIPGDLVEFCGKVQRIENIDKQTSYRVSIKLEHGWFVNKPEEILNFLKPIPLTPAILEANGWTSEPFGVIFIERYKKSNDIDIFLYRTEDNIWSCSLSNYRVSVKFVHDLQHLLFGLGLNSELKV